MEGVTEDKQVKVRLVSGDHHEACKRTAIHAGIVTHEQAEQEGVCMSGDDFLAAVGRYDKEWSPKARRRRTGASSTPSPTRGPT